MYVLHLLIRYTLADILQVGADVLHIGEAQKDFCKVFLADGGHSFRVGQKLNFQHFCLEVVHKPEEEKMENSILEIKKHVLNISD